MGQRLSRCLSELLWCAPDADKKHKAVKNAAILAKCFEAGVWNNTDFVSKQIERVGNVYSAHLKSAGYTTFAREELIHCWKGRFELGGGQDLVNFTG